MAAPGLNPNGNVVKLCFVDSGENTFVRQIVNKTIVMHFCEFV